MAPIMFLLALFSLAIFSCSLGPTSVNAMSIDSHIVNRRTAHDSLAKRGGLTRRCKQRSPPESSSAPPANAVVPSSSSPTPTPTPTPTATPTTTTGSGTKLGLDWNGPAAGLELLAGKAKFLYTWSAFIPANAKQLGYAFVPQLWGPDKVDEFTKNVVEGYATYVLGMNEPNQDGQAKMTPEAGAALWRQYIQPLKDKGYQLGSPAMSSDVQTAEIWMNGFTEACQGCIWHFTCVHWYDMSFHGFKNWTTYWHDKYNKDIWITEFALHNYNNDTQPSYQEIWDFHVEVANWVKQIEWIVMVAPFAFVSTDQLPFFPTNNFISNDGTSLTKLGAEIIGIYNS